jgi:DNA-binding MarR family transcriptional regulator
MRDDDAKGDAVDQYREAWRNELPAVDTEPMAILGRINRVANLITPAIEQLFARHGLDRGEFDVLATLRRSGPPYRLTPTELYTSLMISSGGLTHRLARLVAAGLIRREPSPTDGRSLLVALTEKGLRLAAAAFVEDMALEGKWIARLPTTDRRRLAALLRRLHKAIVEEHEEAVTTDRPTPSRAVTGNANASPTTARQTRSTSSRKRR